MDELSFHAVQEERERQWVSQGAERFRRHIERPGADAAGSPGGPALIRDGLVGFEARIEAWYRDTANAARTASTKLYDVVTALGSRHVAAVAMHAAVRHCIAKGSEKRNDGREIMATATGRLIGGALHHDTLYGQAKKDAKNDPTLAGMVRKMKDAMEKPMSDRQWRNRLNTLR